MVGFGMASGGKANRNTDQATFFVNLDGKGRLVLPVELRKKAGFETGDVFSLSLDRDSVIHISSVRNKIRSLRGILKSPKKKGSIVDELLAERKREALNE